MENKAEKTGQTSLFLLVRNTDNVEDVTREKKQKTKKTYPPHTPFGGKRKKHVQT